MKSSYSELFILSIAIFSILVVLTNSLMLGPLLVLISSDLNITVAMAGQLVAITSASWAITGPSGGPFSDTYGRRPVILTGISIMILGNLLTLVSQQFISIALARLLTGFGAGLVPPTIVATIGDHIPIETRGKSIGIMMGATRVGTIFALPAIAMIGDSLGWRVPFGIMSLILSILIITFWFIFPKSDNLKRKPLDFFNRLLRALGTQSFKPLLLANLLTQSSAYIITTYLAALLISRYNLTVSEAGIPTGIVVGGMALGSMVGGRFMTTKFGPRLALGSLIISAIMGPLSFSTPIGSVFVIFFTTTLGFSVMLCVTSFLTITTNLSSTARGASVGLFAASNQLGAILGSAIGGLILGLTSSYDGLGLVISVFGILGLISAGIAMKGIYIREGEENLVQSDN